MPVCPFLLTNPNAADVSCREEQCALWVPVPKFEHSESGGICAFAKIAHELKELATTVEMMQR